MSVIFEGILINTVDLNQISTDLNGKNFGVKNLDSKTFLVFEENTRQFSDEFENIAVYFSKKFNKVLLIRFDSRISYRYSAVYEDGIKTYEYDENDELFVLIDEDGEPIIDGLRFQQSEFEPDEEYETIINAIQLGFEKVNIDKQEWDSFFDLINNL